MDLEYQDVLLLDPTTGSGDCLVPFSPEPQTIPLSFLKTFPRVCTCPSVASQSGVR